MARKPYPEEPDQPERWLVSYADFITLLFAFFVVMYSISSVQENKVQQFSSSIHAALGKNGDLAPASVNPTQPSQSSPLVPQLLDLRRKKSVQREHSQMNVMAAALDDKLASLVRQGNVRVSQSSRGISIEINASILFAPADARLNPASVVSIQSIADVLRTYPNTIEVEGYTDTQAIKTAEYPSNWELSAARASRVVRLLAEAGIQESRLRAIGSAVNHPVASNATAEGRQRNRRVEIQILPTD